MNKFIAVYGNLRKGVQVAYGFFDNIRDATYYATDKDGQLEHFGVPYGELCGDHPANYVVVKGSIAAGVSGASGPFETEDDAATFIEFLGLEGAAVVPLWSP